MKDTLTGVGEYLKRIKIKEDARARYYKANKLYRSRKNARKQDLFKP